MKSNRERVKEFYSKRKHTRAISTKVDGIHFPSQLEASVYCLLKLMVQSGEYENLRVQQLIPLAGKVKYKIDFVIFNKKRGVDEGHEAKGREFERFKVIKQLWPELGPFDLFLWTGSADKPRMTKVIRGKP